MASGGVNVIEIPSSNPTGDAVLCIHGLCYDAIFYSQAAEYSEDDRGKFVSSIVEWLDSVERKLET